jgi:CO/xanthine dehydrogenase Mo-binding subunit
MSILGTSRRRLEGEPKVRGRLQFTADLATAGLAHARLVLSAQAHARIVRIDGTTAEALPGVLAVVTSSHLPRLAWPSPELPLANGKVSFAGQPVAAVVAESAAAAADGAELVRVEYEPLAAVIDPDLAMDAGAPVVLDSSGTGLDDDGAHGATVAAGSVEEETPANVHSRKRFQRGDAALALEHAEVVVERRYEIAAVHQGFIEPHVSAARVEADGSLTVHTSTQGAFLCRKTLARMLDEPISRFRVVPMPVGGGFGGKICLLEPLAVLLARLVERPVRVELTRSEEFLMGRGGPAASVDLRLGANRDGQLVSMWARILFDNGASAGSLGGFAAAMMGGAYRVPNLDLTGIDVATHKTPVGAYRAPGAPQVFFALESAMDEMADRLGMDPIELRLTNASREGDPRPDGTVWPAIGLAHCLEAARRHPLYRRTTGNGHGVGVAIGGWGGGREPSAAACRSSPTGRCGCSSDHRTSAVPIPCWR